MKNQRAAWKKEYNEILLQQQNKGNQKPGEDVSNNSKKDIPEQNLGTDSVKLSKSSKKSGKSPHAYFELPSFLLLDNAGKYQYN